MENHHPSTSTSTSTCHSNHHQSLPFDPREEQPLTTLPIFDSTSTLHVPSLDILHTNNVMYNQPHKNPKRKRSRFLKITSPTCSSDGEGVSKPKITKKPPDPSAPKITRPCTECGKRFWSWKALFGHMRCHPERQWRGINPPPNFRTRQHNNVDDSLNSGSEFSPSPSPSPRKNIILLSDTIMTDEDHEVAACLLRLANSSSKPDEIIVNNEKPPDNENVVKDNVVVASEDNQPCLMKDNRFECSGCKKVFGSHQALGGHRASHKNVKGCFASASASGLTQAAVVVSPIKAHDNDAAIANLDLNFPPPVTLMISGEDQYDSSSSYSSTYSGSGLDLRLKL